MAGLQMKIENIEVQNLRFVYPTASRYTWSGGTVTGRLTSIIRVYTDTGLVGLGAAYSHPGLLKIIIEDHLTPFLLGRDPRKTDDLWSEMYFLTRWYGRKGVAISALGGLDIAFWDLRGKDAGEPISQLLGGTRDHIPAYASGLFWHDRLEDLANEARGHIGRGFQFVKMRLGMNQAYDTSALDAVQSTIGANHHVMVDGSHRYTVANAMDTGAMLAERGVVWFEEPFAPEEIDSYVGLRGQVGVPVAAGENEFGIEGFHELIRAGAVDIVQPDASRAGGISACHQIARMAEYHGLRVAPHTWSDAVALVANAHVAAATRVGMTVEVDQTGNPFIDELLVKPLVIEDGVLQLPDGPGLGVEVNEAILSRFALTTGVNVPDGHYSDLIFGLKHVPTHPPYEP